MPTLKVTRRANREYNVNLVKRRNWYTDPPPVVDPPAPPLPPVVPPPAPEPKFTQAEMDAVAGNTRKEAAAAARNKFLEELGFDPKDPKVIELLKGKLTAAADAEKAKMSAEQLAQKEIDDLKKERDEAKTNAEKATAKAVETLVNGKLETLAGKAGAQHPEDVINRARNSYADDVAALMNDKGEFDGKKAEALIAKIKTERPNYFDMRRGAGTGSHGGGRADNDGSGENDRAAQVASFARSRRVT